MSVKQQAYTHYYIHPQPECAKLSTRISLAWKNIRHAFNFAAKRTEQFLQANKHITVYKYSMTR